MPKSPEEIFRDTTAPGSPARYNPPKADVRELLRYMLDLITALSAAAGFNPALLTEFKTQITASIDNSFTAINQSLDSKVNQINQSLANTVSEINLTVAGAVSRVDVLDGEVNTLENNLAINIRRLLSYIEGTERPSENIFAFSSKAIGDVNTNPSLLDQNVIRTVYGRAYRIDGAGVIAPRSKVIYDPDLIFVVRAIYWRNEDVLDPNNNAVDFGIQWLDANDATNGAVLLHRESNLKVQDGLKTVEYRVPSLDTETPVIKAPRGTVAWRPYIEAYGRDGSTAVQLLAARDVTYAGVYAPDVSELAARVRSIEGTLAAGVPLSTPILPQYTVADLATMVPTFGRKAMALDGRAPNAAGVLEPPNAGTGVEVTGNGVVWAISGTNQAVQA